MEYRGTELCCYKRWYSYIRFLAKKELSEVQKARKAIPQCLVPSVPPVFWCTPLPWKQNYKENALANNG